MGGAASLTHAHVGAPARAACARALTPCCCTAWRVQTRSVLLLWLSILVLIPFGLATVDSSLKGGAGDADATPPVVHALLAQCRCH